MNVIESLTENIIAVFAPTPKRLKKVRNVALLIGSLAGGALLLPVLPVAIVPYITLVATAASGVAAGCQLSKQDEK